MLAIRLQRTGRSGTTQFRVIVQDSRFSPTRGRVVAYLGSYDPHSKTAALDSVKAADYLKNGAQPSDRVARLFQKEGIKLPEWVKLNEPKQRTVRHPEKRRSTRPEGAEPAAQPEASPPEDAGEPAAETPVNEEPAEPASAEPEPAAEEPAKEPAPAPEPAPAAEEPAAETPSEDKSADSAA